MPKHRFKVIDMESAVLFIGATYGRLTLQAVTGTDKWGNARVKANCECGGVWEGNLHSVLAGNTRSCGCLRRYGVKPRYRMAVRYMARVLREIKDASPDNPKIQELVGKAYDLAKVENVILPELEPKKTEGKNL